MLSAKEVIEYFYSCFSLVETEVYSAFLTPDLSHIPVLLLSWQELMQDGVDM